MNKLLGTMAEKIAHIINVLPKDINETLYVDNWEKMLKSVTRSKKTEVLEKVGNFITSYKDVIVLKDRSEIEVTYKDDIIIPKVKVTDRITPYCLRDRRFAYDKMNDGVITPGHKNYELILNYVISDPEWGREILRGMTKLHPYYSYIKEKINK